MDRELANCDELFPAADRAPVDDVTDDVDPMKFFSSTEQFPGLL